MTRPDKSIIGVLFLGFIVCGSPAWGGDRAASTMRAQAQTGTDQVKTKPQKTHFSEISNSCSLRRNS